MTTTPMHDRPAETARHRSIPADTFRARLMLARMHAGNLSIREAAAQCGLNYGTWGNWERGDEPRGLLTVVEKISAGLGVDREWLLFGGPLSGAADNERRWSRVGSGIMDGYSRRPASLRPPGRPDRSRPTVIYPTAA